MRGNILSRGTASASTVVLIGCTITTVISGAIVGVTGAATPRARVNSINARGTGCATSSAYLSSRVLTTVAARLRSAIYRGANSAAISAAATGRAVETIRVAAAISTIGIWPGSATTTT
jgi:hypothetical protein